MRLFSTGEERPHLVIKRRRGRLVAVANGGGRTLRVLAECLAMMGVSCSILACGCQAGFYSSQEKFNAQGQYFAESTIKAVMAGWTSEARLADQREGPPAHNRVASIAVLKGCFGQSRLELFNPAGLVFASYVCEVEIKDGVVIANLGLRRSPDAWKITSLYVNDPVRARHGA